MPVVRAVSGVLRYGSQITARTEFGVDDRNNHPQGFHLNGGGYIEIRGISNHADEWTTVYYDAGDWNVELSGIGPATTGQTPASGIFTLWQ
jgi:hypothetical protein